MRSKLIDYCDYKKIAKSRTMTLCSIGAGAEANRAFAHFARRRNG